MIFLYRRPILDEWAERGNVSIQELVSHVVIHEIKQQQGRLLGRVGFAL